MFITLANYVIGASLYERARHPSADPAAPRRFDALERSEHPTVYRLRDAIAHASDDSEFRAALSHLVNSFAPGAG